MDEEEEKSNPIHLVSCINSPEFTHLTHSLTRSSIIALDAEWKPTTRSNTSASPSPFPTVTLLQIACRTGIESVVFLLDLLALPLPQIYDLLKDVFESPHVLKLGFRFKQDLVYLSATFSAQGCEPGFNRVEPFLDINAIYGYLCPSLSGLKLKNAKGLATICREVLGISLSKELQCSDWSLRPLTEEQKLYAAADAQCLLEIFTVFQLKLSEEGSASISNTTVQSTGDSDVIEGSNLCDSFCKIKIDEASQVLFTSAHSDSQFCESDLHGIVTKSSSLNTKPMEDSLLEIVNIYGDKILLDESSRTRKTSRRRKRQPTNGFLSEKNSGLMEDWLAIPPWDLTLGGDGCAKFLCDVMVEGLAKHLRCVGIDAAVPCNKKPEARELIDQACREKRVLLTRDTKLLRHEYLLSGQIYRVKSLLKNEQLLEVIETFQLKIDEDRLMSRCTKCNGSFIQRPLSAEEAIEAAKGFQKIPSCLYNKDIEFWQCRDCRQLYWEGTQYHNAVQKFIDVCKLNE